MSVMKKIAAVWGVIALALCVSACSTRDAVEISCDDFYAQQHVNKAFAVGAGKPFTVVLCSNPSTGFTWGQAVISDSSVVVEVAHEYDAREGRRPPAPGTPGVEVWTFRPLEPGQSTISIEYGRPWEEGKEAEWTFVLTLVVE